jgi:hypothetical protein
MPRRKNLRLHLKEGDLIRTSDNEVYEVLYLGKEDFQCRNIDLIGSDMETIQRFYYTVDMIIFREYARNVPS